MSSDIIAEFGPENYCNIWGWERLCLPNCGDTRVSAACIRVRPGGESEGDERNERMNEHDCECPHLGRTRTEITRTKRGKEGDTAPFDFDCIPTKRGSNVLPFCLDDTREPSIEGRGKTVRVGVGESGRPRARGNEQDSEMVRKRDEVGTVRNWLKTSCAGVQSCTALVFALGSRFFPSQLSCPLHAMALSEMTNYCIRGAECENDAINFNWKQSLGSL